eukprot:1183465-Prorocentrum_minimum.AAC.1
MRVWCTICGGGYICGDPTWCPPGDPGHICGTPMGTPICCGCGYICGDPTWRTGDPTCKIKTVVVLRAILKVAVREYFY